MATDMRSSSIPKATTSNEAQEKTKKMYSGLKYAISWIAYVLIGSWIFLVLEESTTETIVENEKWTRFKELIGYERVVEELHELRKHLNILCPHSLFNSTFDDFYSGMVESETLERNSSLRNVTEEWVAEVEIICTSTLFIVEQVTDKPHWSMVDAIYYTMTLVTTIGFGHIYPATDMGKMFCIPYALVGVPLTCILMAKTSDMLSNRMLHFYQTTKKRYRKHPQILLGVVTWLFLIVGCFVFMFLPSLVFAVLEEWSHIDSFYFTFITLSTIGFGDLIAGYGEPHTHSDIYKVVIVVWIMIALGYWIFLLNFLQKAIKSNAKTLKKTFRSKNISKQAEFLKQLITKVTQQDEGDEDDGDYDKRLHMMALIVESLGESASDIKYNKSYSSIHSNRTGLSKTSISRSAKRSGSTPQDRLQLMTMMVEALWRKPSHVFDNATVESEAESLHESEEESDSKELDRQKTPHKNSVSFQDLMRLKVSIKTETLPGFESLVEQSGYKEYMIDNEESNIGASLSSLKEIKEVTLPLKDVLSIVLLVASFDEDMQHILEDDTQSESSETSSAGAAVGPRESVPLLKKIMVKHSSDKPQNGPNLHEKEHTQSPYIKSTLSNYLEDCDAQIAEGIEPTCEDDDRNLRMKKSFIV